MKTATNTWGYYTPGNPKRDRRITKQWWDRAVLKATTQDDIVAELNALRKNDPKAWLRLIMESVPKESLVKTDSSITISFNLEGVRPAALDITPVTHQLPLNDDPGDD